MADDRNYDVDDYGMSYRKNPPRTRKKSRYYEEYYEATPQYKSRDSPRIYSPIRPIQPDDAHRVRRNPKQHKGMPSSVGWRNTYANPERRTAQGNAVRLRNVLKLPKAHKWVFYEWLYSNLDRPLLLSENDFRICLRENFPNVKTRRLTRAHWSLLRRLMGKPRRCSTSFFEEERRSLNEKREKIRTLQATRSVQLEFLRDLPDDMHVPMPLIIGTRINARVRFPTDGLYPGKVDAIDSLRHCYRVTFDRPNLGTRSIPDYEVISIDPQETIPLSAYKTQHKASRNLFMSPARLLAQSALQGKRHMHHHKIAHAVGSTTSDFGINDCPLCQAGDGTSPSTSIKAPSMGEMTSGIGGAALSLNDPSTSGGRLLLNESDIYGGYPMKFLVMVTKLSKILEVKKMCVDELQDLNTEAERKISNQSEISVEFQHKYLTLIVHLERLNRELNQYLIHVLQYANEIAQEHGVPPLEQPADFKQRCDEDAYDIVNRVKSIQVQRLRNMKNMDLITRLTGILVQIRSLSEQDSVTPDCSSVLDSLRDLKTTLHSSNIQTFEDMLEVKIHHVMSGLNTQGNLHAFLYMHPNHMHLHQDVDETTLLDYAGDEENGSSEIELKEEQVMSSDMQDEQVATRIEINDIVEEVKEDNFREECTPIHLNNSLKATEPAHPHPRFTAFEIPVHTGPCAMLTPMIPRNSPCDTVEAESHRPVETASTVTYSHPKTHSLVHSRRYTPLRGQLRKKSTPPPQRKTLCQKYPQTYRKARESVLPLITDSAPSTQTNDSTSSFRPERSCSLRKLNVSSEWRTNRLAGDTWIHYPNRVSTFQATRRLRLPQNPSTRRLKPIDKSTIPTNPAAGDQTLFPSKPHKPPSPMLPPLSRSAVSRFRPVCNRGGGGWGEVGLGAPNSRNGGSSLPPPTSFSSPRVENPNPFNPFTLQTEGYDNNEELLSRDQIIFRNSKITGETSYFKQYSLDEIHGSTKH